jgi:hypothetical protein
MSEYNHSATDLKSLIGEMSYSGYIYQEQSREAVTACIEDNEPFPICYFCKNPIVPEQAINLHHTTYKSRGGTCSGSNDGKRARHGTAWQFVVQ